MQIDRRTFSSTLLAGAVTALAPGAVKAATTAPSRSKNVVLIHGLYADGSSWSDVIPYLQAHRLNVTSVQQPLTTLPDAVAACQRVLARQDGPTILAGHSFGGTVVTEAGVHPNVSAVVYVAARAPDVGENFADLAKRFPSTTASAGVVFDGDEGRLDKETFLRDFAPDLPRRRAEILYAVQWPFNRELMAGRTTQAAWQGKPSYYAVSTQDRVINPELQRFMAKRIKAKTIELPSSHVSLLSHPREIADLIIEAAAEN